MSSGDSPGRRRKDDPASAITGEQMENNVRGQTDPRWLLWAREMQALAQTGLALTRDPYDRERYQRLRGLAARIMTEHRGQDVQPIEALFAGDIGYATPKLDITRGGIQGQPVAPGAGDSGWRPLDAPGRLGRRKRKPS